MNAAFVDRESVVYLVGRRNSAHVQDLRDFPARNRVPFGCVDLDHDPLVHAPGHRSGLPASRSRVASARSRVLAGADQAATLGLADQVPSARRDEFNDGVMEHANRLATSDDYARQLEVKRAARERAERR